MSSSEFDTDPNAPSTFHLAVSQNAALQARWDAVAESVIAHAASIGVTLSKTDVERIPSAKLAVLTGQPLEGEMYAAELRQLPAYAKAMDDKAQADAIKRGESEALSHLERLSPAERITFARQHGLDRPVGIIEPSAQDMAAKVRVLDGIKNPAAKIAMARRLGVA